jgi:hypothetical protein
LPATAITPGGTRRIDREKYHLAKVNDAFHFRVYIGTVEL